MIVNPVIFAPLAAVEYTFARIFASVPFPEIVMMSRKLLFVFALKPAPVLAILRISLRKAVKPAVQLGTAV